MSSRYYRLVFTGEIQEGFDKNTVKNNLAQLFKKDLERIELLFGGKPVILKKSEDRATVETLAEAMRARGAVVAIHNPTRAEGPVSNVEPVAPPEPQAQSEADQTPQQSPQPTATPAADPPSPDKEENRDALPISWRQRLKYKTDSFMSKGGASTFKALVVAFLVIFLLVAGLRGLLQAIYPGAAIQYEDLDFLGNIYITFLQLTDPGNMAQDILSSGWYKLFAILSGVAGIILLSALIAFITTALDQKLSELKRGRSKVVEEGHTLILGWDEQRIVEIIRELIIANESEKDACVVILAEEDKETMDDMLRLRLPDRATTRIVTRSGRVSTLANLDMVSIERCKSVIILASCTDTSPSEEKISSDAKVIQTILATSGKGPHDEDFCIAAEIFNSAYRNIVEQSFSEHVVIVDTSDILAKLLVQTSRSVGLSVVYNEILSFDGCEMYFYHADWGDIRFGDLPFRFPDGIPMAVRQGDGDLLMNPSPDYTMRGDDDILILADDDSTIEFQPEALTSARQLPLPEKKLQQTEERELIIGWNHKAPIIINEFSDYVLAGSQIQVLLSEPTEEIRRDIEQLNEALDDIELSLIAKNPLNADHLMSIEPFSYNNIIILASIGESNDAQQVDSENIVTLLLLRSIFNQYPEASASTRLITEILDSQNLPLVAQAGVKDVIISNRLLSMVVAQISENKDIMRVYDDIFQEDGSEIYLKPADLYFDDFPAQVTYGDLIRLTQEREEVCLGVKIKALEPNAERNNGVQLIPAKDTRYELVSGDCLVVLAEDEL